MEGYLNSAVTDNYFGGNYWLGSPEFEVGAGAGMPIRCLARQQQEIDRSGF